MMKVWSDESCVVGVKVLIQRQLVKGIDFSACSLTAKDWPGPQRSPDSESQSLFPEFCIYCLL